MTPLRLITFNIAHGRGLAPIQGLTSPRKLRVNLRKIAALLAKLSPDVVALQEIDEHSRWSGNFDHLDYLRVHADFPYAAFGINNRRAGLLNLCYGNALLSRHPLIETETVVFGQRRVGEKGFLYAEINIDGHCVPFVNLHLQFNSRARRLVQLDLLTSWLRQKKRSHGTRWTVPPIICGDFNNPNTAHDATSALVDHLAAYGDYVVHPQTGGTFPSPLPQRTLDFIFLPSGCRLIRCEVVRTFLSDHRPVLLEFSIG
jgi:endonuclease/exonuclease/phosphatase family metal-dependent hydrolase